VNRVVRHVVRDWNGTLLNDLDIVVGATNASLAGNGIAVIDRDRFRREFSRPIRSFNERLLGRPLTDQQWRTADDAFHDHYRWGRPVAAQHVAARRAARPARPATADAAVTPLTMRRLPKRSARGVLVAEHSCHHLPQLQAAAATLPTVLDAATLVVTLTGRS
jgi:hypothetical protein